MESKNRVEKHKNKLRFNKGHVSKAGDFVKSLFSTRKRKTISISAIVFALLIITVSIPFTRYAVLGLVVKKDVTLKVVDQSLKKPVSDAAVSLGGVEGKTDSSGTVVLKDVSVGVYELMVNKQLYTASTRAYIVPVIGATDTTPIEVKAQGRQVLVSIVDSISKVPVDSAKLSVGRATAITDKDGVATIVIPADQKAHDGVFEKDGYNVRSVKLSSDNTDKATEFTLTASGHLFYLSKSTGKINVMKSNLDGSNPEVVITGTGKERDESTSLLAARDWKYLALLARRDSEFDKVYIINTETGELITADEGSASFSFVGWSGHDFIYKVTRDTGESWDNQRQVLKAYDVESKKITSIDQALGSGTSYYDFQREDIGNPYILNNEVVYTKSWSRSAYRAGDFKMSIMSATTDGKKRVIKEVVQPQGAYVNIRFYKPQEIYAGFTDPMGKVSYYEYENGVLGGADTTTDDQFNSAYPTYLVSPDAKRVFWSEVRDGKNSLFIGDKNGASSQQIASLSDYTPYGWYTDKYILLAKNGSELYIAPTDTVLDDIHQPVKVANYHKPYLTYPGYGYGYGGQ
ncbi:MAG TPA: hypothetical protein VF281_04675 [Candidatus Saccharimonadales bacterium]